MLRSSQRTIRISFRSLGTHDPFPRRNNRWIFVSSV
jgi:hypothetical protein